MDKPKCCYIEEGFEGSCGSDADFEINDGPTSDDFTQACTAHVGFLLQDNRVSHVYPLPNPVLANS